MLQDAQKKNAGYPHFFNFLHVGRSGRSVEGGGVELGFIRVILGQRRPHPN